MRHLTVGRAASCEIEPERRPVSRTLEKLQPYRRIGLGHSPLHRTTPSPKTSWSRAVSNGSMDGNDWSRPLEELVRSPVSC